MVSNTDFSKLALSFQEVTEEPHFEKASYRIRKKIFATIQKDNSIGCLKLTEVDQSVYCEIDKSIIYPVPNKWGKQGWTYVDLGQINKKLLKEMMTKAYCSVAPEALSRKYQ